MQAQNIQVFVRTRPLEFGEQEIIDVIEESQKVVILDKNNNKSYSFDQVFSAEAQQEIVYNVVVKPLIKEVLAGFNCTVFAYGQTGTGKTYTMEGERSNENISWEEDPHLGIIPRAISHLFDELKNYDDDCKVTVSFLELYNEDTYDLLSPLHDTTKLKIFEDANKKGSVIVGSLEEIVVNSKSAIYEILKRGSAKRQTAATLLNACSSRSHTVFKITVHVKDRSFEGVEVLKTGKLNLVDLAGSENIGRSGAQDKRAREVGSINQSLLTLGRVITALVEKRPHIPYRESKLTRLLQDSLGGRTKTSIIATISPACIDLDNTIGTLEYASHARKIMNRPELNQGITQKSDILREIMEKHALELNQLEINVRNEVAAEFKREVEKMKQSYQQSSDDMSNLNKDLYKQLKNLEQLAEYRKDLSDQLSSELKLVRAENLRLKEEIRVLNETLPAPKIATRVRKKNDVLDESNDYANMTFDGGDDEILQVSAKKARKNIGPVKRRRPINEAITLSGKKKKLNNPTDIITEVSPIAAPGPMTRSNRSRIKKKLEF